MVKGKATDTEGEETDYVGASHHSTPTQYPELPLYSPIGRGTYKGKNAQGQDKTQVICI